VHGAVAAHGVDEAGAALCTSAWSTSPRNTSLRRPCSMKRSAALAPPARLSLPTTTYELDGSGAPQTTSGRPAFCSTLHRFAVRALAQQDQAVGARTGALSSSWREVSTTL
jgi:hypothetical protein